MPALIIFPYFWVSKDVHDKHVITACARTLDGTSVCLNVIDFPPFFYVDAGAGPGEVARARLFLQDIVRDTRASHSYSTVVERTSIWGWGQQRRPFCQLAFDTLRGARRGRAMLEERNVQTYEARADPLHKFFAQRGLSPHAWVEVQRYTVVPPGSTRRSRCDLEVNASFRHVVKASDISASLRPPLVFCSWDIEVYSKDRTFPKASRPSDAIIMIACCFWKYTDPVGQFRRVCIALGSLESWEEEGGVEVISCASEAEVINAFIHLTRDAGADVLIGYNTNGFDWKYVYERATMLVDDETGDPSVELEELGRIIEGAGELVEKNLSSAAYGQNSFVWISAPGILNLDVMTLIKKDHKLERYSLNHVSSTFLEDTKDDLSAAQLFDAFDAGDIQRIARYCVKDTELPLRLMIKLCLWEGLMGLASATCCPVDWLVNRGQQVRVFGLILQKSRSIGGIVPDLAKFGSNGDDDGYKGATVLEPIAGAHANVITLDFASLYPSIIRACCLDYTSLVLRGGPQPPPGTPVVVIEGHTFVQGGKTVLPALLEDLAVYRKESKKNMEAAISANDHFATSVHNCAQLAYKVVMNSAYGFCGAIQGGMLPCKPIAQATTAYGRDLIQRTAEIAARYGTVVYGDTDSVMISVEGDDMAAHFKLGEQLAEMISQEFPHPILLEFEKVYSPLLMFTKKRYAAMMHASLHRPPKRDIKGLQVIRRDSPAAVRDAISACLDAMLRRAPPSEVVDIARRKVLDIATGKCSVDDLVTTKAYRSDVKVPQNHPHCIVASKIMSRRGQAIASGTRVPFVYCLGDSVDSTGLLAAQAEDPEYYKEHVDELALDLAYYCQQMVNPYDMLLKLMNLNTKEVFDWPPIKQAIDRLEKDKNVYARKRKNRCAKQPEITRFFSQRTSLQ